MSTRVIFVAFGCVLLGGCLPDLTISDDYTLNQLTDGTKLKVEVQNIGTAAAGPFLVYFNACADEAGQNIISQENKSFSGLAAGGADSRTVVFPASVTGYHWIIVIADSKNTVEESNEDNNVLTVPVPGP